MKIPALKVAEAQVTQQPAVQRHLPRPTVPPEGGTATQDMVRVSSISQFVTKLRHAANTHGAYGNLRDGVVRQIREDMDAGRFGTDDDVERAIDSLLRSL